MLHRLRELGLSARVFEAGDGVGGTWYWNRYPGARCDVESMDYSYSFSDELAAGVAVDRALPDAARDPALPQPRRRPLRPAPRHPVRHARDVGRTSTRPTNRWTVDHRRRRRGHGPLLHHGRPAACRPPNRARLPGPRDLRGPTGTTPAAGRTRASTSPASASACIGTGSSAIQSIPHDRQAGRAPDRLPAHRRTSAIPAQNAPLDPSDERADQGRLRRAPPPERAAVARSAAARSARPQSALEVTPEERGAQFETRWQTGGSASLDGLQRPAGQRRRPTRPPPSSSATRSAATVHDPAVAESLPPTDHPFGTKRLCVDIDYYETYNRDNVTLVDLQRDADRRDHADGRPHATARVRSSTASSSPPASTR